MYWLRENWFWVMVVVLFFWMHMKMHGGHGGHGGHRHSRPEERPPEKEKGDHHAEH